MPLVTIFISNFSFLASQRIWRPIHQVNTRIQHVVFRIIQTSHKRSMSISEHALRCNIPFPEHDTGTNRSRFCVDAIP